MSVFSICILSMSAIGWTFILTIASAESAEIVRVDEHPDRRTMC